jgi:ribokinase
MSRKIVVLGSSNTDMIINLERIPKPGETVLGGAFSMAGGGKGANQAVAAARAGGDVALIARVGKDIFGDQAVRGFREAAIDVDFVIRDEKAPSGVALIFVDREGENCIAVASGANARLSPGDVRRAERIIAGADILLMQLETPLETVRLAAEIASANAVRIILNPAPARPLPDDILRNVSILTPNEIEAGMLTGEAAGTDAEAVKVAQILRGRGVDTVVLTLGARGAYVAGRDFEGMVPGFKVKPVDTTAAGDVFNGALAVALSGDARLQDAVRFANAAAAISVTISGAQTSAPHREDIDRFLAAQFPDQA